MKKILLLSIAIFLISSCTEFLSEKPNKNTSLVPTQIEQLEYLLNNYSSFYSEGNRQVIHGTDDYGLMKELVEAKASTYSAAQYQFATWDVEFLPLDGREGYWAGEYKKIFTANMILKYIPLVSGSEDVKKEVEHEARLLRAYSMLQLVQTYCLPYNESTKNEMGLTLKASTSFEENTERATLEATYKMIEDDIKDALNISTEMTVVNNKYTSWRGNKAAANALAARFYLLMGDYEAALGYAENALKSHNVFVDYNTDMKYSDIVSEVTVGSDKIKLEYPYTHDNQSDMTDMLEWKEFMYFRMLNHESWWYIPSRELLALYDQQYDLRYRYHIVEHYSYDRGLTAPAYDYPGYIFFFKDRLPSGPTTAEMTLVKAECQARLGNYADAMNTVNILREKRFDKTAPVAAIKLTASSKEEAIAKIIEERRREMPFTQRWFDIRRYNNNDYPGDDIDELTREFYSYNNAGLDVNSPKTYSIKKDSRRWAAPLHQSELEASNGVIKQNIY